MTSATTPPGIAAQPPTAAALNDAILATVVDAIIVIDAKGTIAVFNRAAETLFGWSAGEAIGRNVSMLMPQPHRGRHDGYLDRYVATGEARVIGIGREVIGVRRDGSQFPMSLAVSEVPYQERRMFAGILRDITDRVARERELETKNQELAASARADRIASRVMLAFGRGVASDDLPASVVKVLAEELNVRPIALYLFDAWHGELRLAASASLSPDYGRSFRPGTGLVGEAAERGELVVVDAPGELALDTGVGLLPAVQAFAMPMVHQERLLGVIAGAAQGKLSDRELSVLRLLGRQCGVGFHSQRQFVELRDLSEQLDERSRKITRQNMELARANRLKSQFLANMSHELRTPLNAIIGFSEALADGLLGEMSAEQSEYIGEILQSGRHLLALINDILDLSKIEAGKMSLDPEHIDGEALLVGALTIVREQAARKGVQLRTDIAAEVGTFVADPRRVRQILYNLLSNAVKFTPDGGSVTLEAGVHGRQLWIAVADTGIGIGREDVPRLFEPFVQVDGGLARRFEGTGLGLAMVRRLAELHGGTVSVTSEEGAGSRFEVRLPLLRAIPARVPPEPTPTETAPRRGTPAAGEDPPAQASFDPRRVLLIERSATHRARIRRYLEEADFDVTALESLDAAEELVQQLAPAVVALDPVGANSRTWASLAALPERADGRVVPLLLLAGQRNGDGTTGVGADAYLAKPVPRRALLEAVRRLLRGTADKERPRVLVVDDDPRAVRLVSSFFAAREYDVVTAYGGREALAEIERRLPDVVILDLMMPDVSGFDVIDSLRASPRTAKLPIMVLTAKQLTAEEERTLQRSVERVWSKASTRPTNLRAQIRALVERLATAPGSEES